MTEETAIAKVEAPDAPAEWGDKDMISRYAGRIKKLMPGDLTNEEALALAQYSAVLDANPFRGEVYAYTDKNGKLVLVEGYKLLIRWARRQCNYVDRYEPLVAIDGLAEAPIGYRCSILRDDAKATLAMLVKAGASWKEALEICAQSAVGVVKYNEMFYTRGNLKGKPISPPKGWTWDEVARKRALKNAINRAYGAPSPREMARATWAVNGTETLPKDWQEALDERAAWERERAAELSAKDRERRGRINEVSAPKAYADLFDDEPEWGNHAEIAEEGEIVVDDAESESPVSPLRELPPELSVVEQSDRKLAEFPYDFDGLKSNHEPNPDLEALDWPSFHDAVVLDMEHYAHKNHVINTLTKLLGMDWGKRFAKTHLWETLKDHQSAERETS